jgi:hypothetical protein
MSCEMSAQRAMISSSASADAGQASEHDVLRAFFGVALELASKFLGIVDETLRVVSQRMLHAVFSQMAPVATKLNGSIISVLANGNCAGRLMPTFIKRFLEVSCDYALSVNDHWSLATIRCATTSPCRAVPTGRPEPNA